MTIRVIPDVWLSSVCLKSLRFLPKTDGTRIVYIDLFPNRYKRHLRRENATAGVRQGTPMEAENRIRRFPVAVEIGVW